jgi:hypothetical protein
MVQTGSTGRKKTGRSTRAATTIHRLSDILKEPLQ